MEFRVEQRTADLAKALHDLQQVQLHLVQSEKMSSLGQLVAGVAHEINNPVNFIYGNLSYANEYIQDLLRLVQLYQQRYPNPLTEITGEADRIDLEFLCKICPSFWTQCEWVQSEFSKLWHRFALFLVWMKLK